MLTQNLMRRRWLTLAGLLVLTATGASGADDYDEGVVRISDNKLPAFQAHYVGNGAAAAATPACCWSQSNHGSSCSSGGCSSGGCSSGHGSGGCSSCKGNGICNLCGCFGNLCGGNCGEPCCCMRCLENCCGRLEAFKRCHFGYLCPDGCCGQGCPPKGCYHLLYAANPEYFDPRDGRVYSAQGYGIPVSVPLAPNVNHTWNYGWGIPSSRLTPISRLPEWGP